MININTVKTGDISFLDRVDLETMVNSVFVEALEARVEEGEYKYEPGKAKDFYEKLEKLIREYADDLKLKPEIYERYELILAKLLWQALPAMPAGSRSKPLASNLIFCLRGKVDVKAYLQNYLNIFEFATGPDKEERQKFLYGLSGSEERIGNQSLKLKTEGDVPPTIKNWIKDFSSYLPEKFAGGKFEQINYMNNSQNVAKLSPVDREILSKVISLFVWLKYPRLEDWPELRKARKSGALPKPAPTTPISPKPIVSDSKPTQGGLTIDKLKSELLKQPAVIVKPPVQVSSLVAEIKREVATKELPAHATQASRPPAPQVSKPVASLDDIKFVDDLKKIDVKHLRQGDPSLQAEKIRSKIAYLASVNRLYPYQVVAIFEQSPLFKTYLAQGSAKVQGQAPLSNLSQAEFEAVADLKKEIERM